MWTKRFWKDTSERVIASFAGGVLAVIGADELFNALSADWVGALAGGLLAAAVSLLKAFIAVGKGDPETASLAD